MFPGCARDNRALIFDAQVSGSAQPSCLVATTYAEPKPGLQVREANGEASSSWLCYDADLQFNLASASASSTATTKGSLYAQASASLSRESTVITAVSEAYASFLNAITMEPPSSDPLATGEATFVMRVDGYINGEGSGRGCVSIFNFAYDQCKETPLHATGVISFDVSATLPLTGVTQLIVGDSLTATADAGLSPGSVTSSADFAHTGQAFLELPAGWTFTSASGDFLASSVPEPSTFVLFIVGLVALPLAVQLAGLSSRRSVL
jgi:hypothetical protein